MLSSYLPVSPAVTIHYRDNTAGNLPSLLLLHSLSDNSHVFDAIISAGLDQRFRIIAPDMRGRGDSSRPATGYSLEDHSRDLLVLLDSLGIEKTYVAGHSFGGLLGLYFAAHYPERVSGLVMIDAAVELHPLTPMFVMLLADRLGKWYPSAEAYLLSMRAMPFMTYWDEDMQRAFLADTDMLKDGSVYVKTRKMHMTQCALAIQAVPKKSWRQWAMQVPGPSLVLCTRQPFLRGQHILLENKARETAILLPGGVYKKVSGNHITMMFGQGATEIAAGIQDHFLPVLAAAGMTNAVSGRSKMQSKEFTQHQ